MGGPTSAALGLNNGGQVVGWADTPQKTGSKIQGDYKDHFHINDYTYHAFVWTPATANGTSGTIIDIDPTPKGTAVSLATDINNIGQVTGSSSSTPRAFLWQGGILTNLLTFGAPSWGEGINNAGQVVGEHELPALNGGTVTHAFLYSGGTVQDLNSGDAGHESWGYAVNDAGQVVGGMDNFSSPEFAYLYGGGTFQNLGTLPGYTTSVATGVNDATAAHPVQVVGDSTVPGFSSHAFVWDSTHGMQRLDSLSAIYGSNANGINASGQIVGSSGASAVLWQPNQATGGYVLTDLNSLLPSKSGWVLQQSLTLGATNWVDVNPGLILSAGNQSQMTITNPAATSFFRLKFEQQ